MTRTALVPHFGNVATPYISREAAEADWAGRLPTQCQDRQEYAFVNNKFSNTSPSTQVGGQAGWMRGLSRLNYVIEVAIPSDEPEALDDGALQVLMHNEIIPSTAQSWGDFQKYLAQDADMLMRGTSPVTGRYVLMASVKNVGFGEKLRSIRACFGLDVTKIAEAFKISRPTVYRIAEGGVPKTVELKKKINKLYRLSLKIRAGYSAGPNTTEEVTAWLNECFANMDRKTIAKSIQAGRTTYGGHPTDPTKIVRVNPDGSRDSGIWTDDGFVPDAR